LVGGGGYLLLDNLKDRPGHDASLPLLLVGAGMAGLGISTFFMYGTDKVSRGWIFRYNIIIDILAINWHMPLYPVCSRDGTVMIYLKASITAL